MPQVCNVHRLRLDVPVERVGPLLDTLGSPDDLLWPTRWPPMRLDGPLGVGVLGAHGPVSYVVDHYVPSRQVRFTFQRPRGFHGHHRFEVLPDGDGTILEHHVEMSTSGLAMLLWPLVLGPLHDALAEDAGARAARAVGVVRPDPPWSSYVRMLRRLFQHF